MSISETPFEPHPGLRPLLEHMRKIDASALYIARGTPPVFRVNELSYPGRVALGGEDVDAMASSLLTESQRAALDAALELNLAISLEDDARYRVNFHFQGGALAMVVRALPTRILSLDELALPAAVRSLCSNRRGLILITGESATARSTLLAAMIDARNSSETGHILTIEDPIEFVHGSKLSLVTQREIGRDTLSYYDALRSALRQFPDLVAVDEIRDLEIFERLLDFAETGHACIASVYASSPALALDRLLSFVPEARHPQLRGRLSRTLRAVLCCRPIATLQDSRALALQIAPDSAAIKELIAHGELDAIDTHADVEDSLPELVIAGRVQEAEAVRWVRDSAAFRAQLDRKRAQGSATPVSSTVLRLAPDPYEPAAVAAAAPPPAAERRTKVGPARS